MREDGERARWQALLAKLEQLGTTVAAVEAAYRSGGGPPRTVGLLHGIVAHVQKDLCPWVERRLDDPGPTEEPTPRALEG